MKKECKEAKKWLNRSYHKSKQLASDKRMLEVLLNLLGSGVGNYQNDGTGASDRDATRGKHEDTLLDYSERKGKVEAEEKALASELAKTREVIDRLEDPDHKAVAIDRYINHLQWNDIAKLEHVSRAQAFRIHDKMLEKMSQILKHEGYI